MFLFQWWLWLQCCTCRWHGPFGACIVELHSQRLCINIRRKSSVNRILGLMQHTPATRACWYSTCADCGNTSRVLRFHQRCFFFWIVSCILGLNAIGFDSRFRRVNYMSEWITNTPVSHIYFEVFISHLVVSFGERKCTH